MRQSDRLRRLKSKLNLKYKGRYVCLACREFWKLAGLY